MAVAGGYLYKVNEDRGRRLRGKAIAIEGAGGIHDEHSDDFFP
jgi:hypothetical protein